jgi:8-oxo-dGTP diphosphatase
VSCGAGALWSTPAFYFSDILQLMEKKKVGAGFGVLVLRENQVLLGKRHTDPAKASSAMHGEGSWTMPGGKLEFGESFEEGATREVLEETGLTIDPNKLTFISVNNDRVEDAHFITIGLLYTDPVGEPRVMEPDEITEWKWFFLNDLPQPLFLPSEKIIRNYLNKVPYSV